jgi:RNA polymerase sigma factor (sigma-70 family)
MGRTGRGSAKYVSVREPDAERGAQDTAALERSLREPAAFTTLFERYFDLVHRYLARQAGVSEADDLTAQTFERAFLARSRFDPTVGSFRSWIFGIATNVVRESRRSDHRRRRAHGRVSGERDRSESSDQTAERVAESDRIATALRSLGDDAREVVLLVAGMGLSYEEAAVALGVPAGTVASRMSRGRRKLRHALDEAKTSATARAAKQVKEARSD